MRALIVGAGTAGFVHSLAYRAHGIEIAGVFDPDARRASELAAMCGRKAVALPTLEALDAVDADIASVCSPPSVHVEQAEVLARSGRAVLIEKPVAVSREGLARLRLLPQCIPVVQWRAGRAIRAVRRAIAQGMLGDAPVLSCDLAWARDDAYVHARNASWGCGAVLSIGVHAIDALQWAVGKEVVDARGTTTRREGAWAETGAVGVVRFEGGACACVRISLDGGADLTRLTFCGHGVTASIEGREADPTASSVRWAVARGTGSHARLDALVRLERETEGSLGPPLLVPYIGDVIASLRDGARPGETERMPSIADCASAHVTALDIAGA